MRKKPDPLATAMLLAMRDLIATGWTDNAAIIAAVARRFDGDTAKAQAVFASNFTITEPN